MDCIQHVLASFGPQARDDRYDAVKPAPSLAQAFAAGHLNLRQFQVLSVLGPRAQDIAVERVVAGHVSMTPEVMAQAIELRSNPLEDACFTGTDCATCRYNSDVQATQGYDALAPGLCVNKVCFEAKTAEALKVKAEPLRKKYRVVNIVVDPRSGPRQWTHVTPDGDNGVGEEQYSVCLNKCAHYGAVIEGGSFRTTERTDVCTNPTCNESKAREHLEQLKAAKREFIWRHALRRRTAMLSAAERSTAFLAAIDLGGAPDDAWKERYGRSGIESALAYKRRYDEAGNAETKEAISQMMSSVISNVPMKNLASMLQALQVNVEEHWCLTPQLLEVFSLDELRKIAHDLDLDSAQMQEAQAQGRLAYAKALGAVLTPQKALGYVPKALQC